MTMEPESTQRRLTHVTAQNPGTQRAHETHDRLLVARFALGDALAPDEAGSLRALLATCTVCAALVGELQVVQRATAESLAPQRPRDFFITAEQAETLRPNAWSRFLGRLSAPRMTVLRPLAGATLAMGIVLVGVSAVVPQGDTVFVEAPNAVANGTFEAPEILNGGGNLAGTAAMGSPAADARIGGQQAKSSPSVESMPMGSPDPRVMMMGPDGSPQPGATFTAYLLPQPTAAPDGRDVQADLTLAASDEAMTPDTIGPALLLLGLLLAVVSALVLVLAWLARRTTDPLLR